MPDTICNTSPLIALDNIGLLELLEGVYSYILVAEEVRNEFGSALPCWIEVVGVQNRNLIRALQLSIDLGESATLALAMERPGARVILDDLKGRKVAQRLGVPCTGLVGVAIKGKRMGGRDRVGGQPVDPPETGRLSPVKCDGARGVAFGRGVSSLVRRSGRSAQRQIGATGLGPAISGSCTASCATVTLI